MSHPSHPDLPSRRAWLRRFGALGVAGPALGSLGLNLATLGQASAAGAGDYKALVCVFLYGGNDAYNTVLATDAASWQAYGAARTASGIALAAPGTPASGAAGATLLARLGGVLPIAPLNGQSRSFALHPALKELAELFSQRRAAVVANVGPLIGPVTKAAVLDGSAALPPKRFSHNDQQACWQSFGAEGSTRGWGGSMMDLLQAGNSQTMFSATSVAGNALWLAGQSTRAYQLAPAGAIRLGGADGTLWGSSLAQQKLAALARSTRVDSVLQREHAAVTGRAIDAEAVLRSALPALNAGPWGSSASAADDPLLQYLDPESAQRLANPLAHQLQAVARLIAARQTLGMTRQVFFVGLQGFDTHDNQTSRQTRLLAQLSQGLAYFDRVLRQMGVDQSVTTFTASEFGRSFAGNGDGCDHGWGGHHVVLGGAVKGGDLYGRFPVYGQAVAGGNTGFSSEDQINAGALIPAIGLDAYAATLGRWLGLSDSQLLGLLPNLGRWSVGARNLGFMG